MGADLGFFAEDRERDYPELNKCPDCETFFSDQCCPICGKVCPEEFRAGNRKQVKQKKYRRQPGNGRVQFVPWYHTVWFIVFMLIVQPVVGLILTWSGVWKTHWKVIVTVLVLLPYIILFASGIVTSFIDSFIEITPPVNLELSEEDYRAACVSPDIEALYRQNNEKIGNYVRIKLTVSDIAASYYYNQDIVYIEANVYLCHTVVGDKTLEFFVVDYRQENQTRLAVGDEIIVWGEVAGEIESDASRNGASVKLPAVYARFIDLQ